MVFEAPISFELKGHKCPIEMCDPYKTVLVQKKGQVSGRSVADKLITKSRN